VNDRKQSALDVIQLKVMTEVDKVEDVGANLCEASGLLTSPSGRTI
jgi:hypothetical protein